MTTTRTARPDELGPLSQVLARAFHDDPVFLWMFPDASARLRKSAALFTILAGKTLSGGVVYTNDALQGGGLWEYMEHGPANLAAQLPAAVRMLPLLGTRTIAVFRGFTRTLTRHPRFPHWYLMTLGIDPVHQRKGVGSALLEPALRRCDAERVCAYLEASRPGNIPFYQRHGFRVEGPIVLPNGPTIYGMSRKPGG